MYTAAPLYLCVHHDPAEDTRDRGRSTRHFTALTEFNQIFEIAEARYPDGRLRCRVSSIPVEWDAYRDLWGWCAEELLEEIALQVTRTQYHESTFIPLLYLFRGYAFKSAWLISATYKQRQHKEMYADRKHLAQSHSQKTH